MKESKTVWIITSCKADGSIRHYERWEKTPEGLIITKHKTQQDALDNVRGEIL